MPEASSMARYLPPGRIFAKFSICDSESIRMSRIRFWSLMNQYSQTLNKVGSIVVNDLEYLYISKSTSMRIEISKIYFASFRFLYFSLLYSVFRA